MLRTAPSAVIATVRDGRPFIIPNLFLFDEESDSIFFHTARAGRTRSNVEVTDRVCLCVSELGRLLPAAAARDFSTEYASVVVHGTAKIVQDSGRCRGIMERFFSKYAPHLRAGLDYEPFNEADLARTTVYEIDIESWSGKRNTATSDSSHSKVAASGRWPSTA